MKVVAFKPEHLKAMALQDAQQYFGDEIMREGYGEALLSGGPAFSAIEGDQVIACAGCVEIWDNRAMAWALVSKDAGRHMLTIHRAVDGFLKGAKWNRIEAAVDSGFDAGMRWIELLGFYNETPDKPMRKYRPNGGDSYLFARVK